MFTRSVEILEKARKVNTVGSSSKGQGDGDRCAAPVTCLRRFADQTKNATAWSQRGAGFPFRVAGIGQAAKLAKDYTHVVIDTGQRPNMEDLKAAAEDCDLLVIPAVPASLDTDGLGQTLRALQEIGATGYRVLLTKVPPYAAKEALELRGLLADLKAPVFKSEIPRLTAFEKAATHGQIVNQADDRNAARAWETYAAAGKEIL